jgi:hypothetical protein
MKNKNADFVSIARTDANGELQRQRPKIQVGAALNLNVGFVLGNYTYSIASGTWDIF